MKSILFFLGFFAALIVIDACNSADEYNNGKPLPAGDSVHIQNVPCAATLANNGYDTSKYLVIVPLNKQ